MNRKTILKLLAVGIVLAVLVCIVNVGLNRSYAKYQRGVCRNNLMAYVQNHAEDENPEGIEEYVKQDFQRDNAAYTCEGQVYKIEYIPQTKNFLVTLDGESFFVSKAKKYP